jgi:hypothetical protein
LGWLSLSENCFLATKGARHFWNTSVPVQEV